MLPPFVENRQSAWLLYNEAKTWSTNPATVLGITDWYVSYCLNQAISYWGTYVENQLDMIEAKTAQATADKRQARLQQLLSDDTEKPKGSFADPALLFS